MGKYSWKYEFTCITWHFKYVKWFEYIMLNPLSWNLKVVKHQLFHVWLTYFCGVQEYFYISFLLISEVFQSNTKFFQIQDEMWS